MRTILGTIYVLAYEKSWDETSNIKVVDNQCANNFYDGSFFLVPTYDVQEFFEDPRKNSGFQKIPVLHRLVWEKKFHLEVVRLMIVYNFGIQSFAPTLFISEN